MPPFSPACNDESKAVRKSRFVADTSRIEEMHRRWMTDEEIGDALGLSAKVVWHVRQRSGINRHR